MSDPQRWLDDETSSSFERELLGAGALSPPRDLEARVWTGLATQLPTLTSGAGAPPGAGAAPAHAASASLATATKSKVILSALSAIGIAGAVASTSLAPKSEPAALVAVAPAERRAHVKPASLAASRSPDVARVDAPPPPTKPIAALARAQTPSNLESVPSAEAQSPAAPSPPAEAPSTSPLPASTSDLREQALRLREARDALARDDLARAEALLAAAARSTSLAEERDALVVQTSAARGDRVRTRALGEAFLANYPSSPLHERVSKIVARSKNE